MTETSSADWYSHISRLIKKRPQLNVYSSGDYAGVLAKESVYAFNYDVHVQSNKPCEVSLGLPFRTRSYTSGDLFGVFSMNEPEGYLRLYIEDAMSRAGIPNKLLFLVESHMNTPSLIWHPPLLKQSNNCCMSEISRILGA